MRYWRVSWSRFSALLPAPVRIIVGEMIPPTTARKSILAVSHHEDTFLAIFSYAGDPLGYTKGWAHCHWDRRKASYFCVCAQMECAAYYTHVIIRQSFFSGFSIIPKCSIVIIANPTLTRGHLALDTCRPRRVDDRRGRLRIKHVLHLLGTDFDFVMLFLHTACAAVLVARCADNGGCFVGHKNCCVEEQ